jgi:hypothetical protein
MQNLEALTSTRKETREIAPSPEEYAGQQLATLAALIGHSLIERESGPLTAATKLRAGELIAEIIPLKLTFSGDFDRTARQIAVDILCENFRMNRLTPNEEWLGKLVEQALWLVTWIVKTKLN